MVRAQEEEQNHHRNVVVFLCILGPKKSHYSYKWGIITKNQILEKSGCIVIQTG